RSSRRWQHLFINGRPVRHPGVNHAIYQGYRTLLMKDRHPAYVLELFLDPQEVDVNVHPAKTEVRLRNGALVHTLLADLLHRALQEAGRRHAFGVQGQPALGGAPALALGGGQGSLLPELSAWRRRTADAPAEQQEVRDASPAEGLPRLERGPAFSRAFPVRALAHPHGGMAAPPAGPGDAERFPGGQGSGPAGEGAVFHFHAVPDLRAGQAPGSAGQAAGGIAPEAGPGVAVLAQLHATYILAQGPEGLVLIDQHAAHERIVFEQYRAQFYGGRMSTERFLVPPTLELTAQNAILLEQYLPQWQQLGFELEAFGRNSYLVRQVPGLLSGKDVQGLVLEVLDELALFGKSGRIEEVVNEILERVACHGAIRAGMALSRPEMESLVAQLEQLDINLYCPHGRPVWIEIGRQELEKRFKRIV
ncbi:MAG TPA: DNA mismatch repair endonuclease MutL, partial [bacterium]|nr:DNA mismatch repair endonuclease MutL [bacterium]